MSRRVVVVRASLLVAFVIVAATLDTSWPPTIPPPAFAKPRNHPSHAPPSELRKEVRAELVPNRPDTLRVPDDVVRPLGIQTAPARTPTRSRTLVLSGSLVLDTHHLAHVHTRFAGEVIELGTVEEPSQGTDGGRTACRPLRFGDRVEQGQLLAILWSSDLGEKKSEYVEAYPDPAPAILEVVAQYRLPGKVRHPQRGTFAQNGMRRLNDPRSTDNTRLTDVKCRFTSGTPARSSRFVSPSQSSGRCCRIA